MNESGQTTDPEETGAGAPAAPKPAAEPKPDREPKPETGEKSPAGGSPGPSLDDVKAWEGYRVDEITGQGVAKVEGVFVDRESGEPAWILAKLGRFGKTVPISVRECAAAAGRVWVPHDREVIRNAPAVDPALPLNREQEQQVLEYYGIPEGVGRNVEIQERAADAETARPAP
jgi:hypothetical protein